MVVNNSLHDVALHSISHPKEITISKKSSKLSYSSKMNCLDTLWGSTQPLESFTNSNRDSFEAFDFTLLEPDFFFDFFDFTLLLDPFPCFAVPKSSPVEALSHWCMKYGSIVSVATRRTESTVYLWGKEFACISIQAKKIKISNTYNPKRSVRKPTISNWQNAK